MIEFSLCGADIDRMQVECPTPELVCVTLSLRSGTVWLTLSPVEKQTLAKLEDAFREQGADRFTIKVPT